MVKVWIETAAMTIMKKRGASFMESMFDPICPYAKKGDVFRSCEEKQEKVA